MVISGTILQVRWPNQECHNTEERWLVNQVKGQPHQAQLTKRESKECNKKFLKYIQHHDDLKYRDAQKIES